jgi:acyl-CoA thioesterase II
MAHGMPSPIHLVPAPETMPMISPTEYAQLILQRIQSVKDPPPTRKLPAIVARARADGEEFVKSMSEEYASRPIDLRYIEKELVTPSERTCNATDVRHYSWFKANGTISDDPRTHAVALAYASDRELLSTSIRAHEGEFDTSDIAVMVSLDHVIYFHEVSLFGGLMDRRLERTNGCCMRLCRRGQGRQGD